jgi:hypothetical protein
MEYQLRILIDLERELPRHERTQLQNTALNAVTHYLSLIGALKPGTQPQCIFEHKPSL